MTLREEIAQIEEDIEIVDDELTDANHTATQMEDLKDRVNELELTVKALSGCNDTFELWHEIDQATGRAVVKEVDRLVESVHTLHYQFGQCLGGLSNLKAQQDPSDPLSADSELMKDMMDILKETVAEKKRELAARVESSTAE